MSQQNLSYFICSVADLLRGDYKQSGYGRVVLPFTPPKRLVCVLEPTKEVALDEKKDTRISQNQPGPLPAEKYHL